MLELVMFIAKILIAISSLFCLIRLLKGPHLADRILAQDTLSVHIIAFLMFLSIEQRTSLYLEAALIVALFAFLSTIVAAKYMNKEKVID